MQAAVESGHLREEEESPSPSSQLAQSGSSLEAAENVEEVSLKCQQPIHETELDYTLLSHTRLKLVPSSYLMVLVLLLANVDNTLKSSAPQNKPWTTTNPTFPDSKDMTVQENLHRP